MESNLLFATELSREIYLLDEVNITCNKNAIPNDPQSPFVTSGVRLGTAAVTSRGMKPEDIDYINVHGTSTPVGDVSEVKAIQALFGEHAYKLNISSTKSMTGHLLGAAGAVEAIASVLAVKNDVIPPTINHEEGDNDPEIDYNLNFTFNKAQQRTVRAALSNTFGFGGHNACVIVKKYTE